MASCSGSPARARRWTATRAAVAAAGRAEIGAEIRAIAVAGHGPTATPVDAVGRPTGPAITWLDSRAGAQRPAPEAGRVLELGPLGARAGPARGLDRPPGLGAG